MPRKAARKRSANRKNDEPERRPAVPPTATVVAAGSHDSLASAPPVAARSRTWLWTCVAVTGLLILHYALAAHSLLQENPTVDEVVHLPAGVTYWQKGTFRLYHHNPPLVKLVAALPVVLANPVTGPLYAAASWRSKDPSPTSFSQIFAVANIPRYLELFQLARLTVPLFSLVGGLVVFAWSRRLYGVWGGLLSLSLWVFCPNILAHGRLVTTDVGSTALGVAATYLFWRYLERPGWTWAIAAGIALGLAQLTKFSMLLLYAVWPFLWLARLALKFRARQWLAQFPRAALHGCAIVALSVATIDAGYFFEGVGIPLGDFEFGSGTLTRPAPPGMPRPRSANPLLDLTWQFRVNRFREGWLSRVPCPLPEHYMLGFDEQKIEAEGIPSSFTGTPEQESSDQSNRGYSVYLNGSLHRSGWRYYFLLALAYKVPEGTWILVLLSLAVAAFSRRACWNWADEIVLWTVPVVVLFSMSFLTDINLGLRYVLPMAPYVFIAAGKLAPWVLGLSGPRKWVMAAIVCGSLAATVLATALIHPHYLAYFNYASGGPDRVPARLVDSNLDWGQDLVGLQRWWQANIPGQPIGLAYFGQINPSIFRMRGEQFDWFLPPVMPRTTKPLPGTKVDRMVGPASRLRPGYYAVSVTLLYGVPWRLYDPAPPETEPQALAPVWNAFEFHAFGYFWQFEPIAKIGHSIYVYHLSEEDVAKAELFEAGSSPGNRERNIAETNIAKDWN